MLCWVFSPLFQTFTRATSEPKHASSSWNLLFCSVFLHDVVMRIQFSFLLKSEPISWCQFWNWDTLYFFCYSLYDHFIRCWAMLHTSGLVTSNQTISAKICLKCFFVISYCEFCFDFLIVEKCDLLSNKQPILASLELSINYLAWSLLKWLNISQWIQRCSVIPTHYGQDLKSLWIAWSETI